MRRTTLLAAALVLCAAPARAQEYVWTEDRPDGVAPVGIMADRTLPMGSLEVAYRFLHSDARGLRFGEEDVEENDVLDLGFTFVPISRTLNGHVVTVGYGILEDLTVMASGGYVQKTRESANEDLFFSNESSGITDVSVDALWEFYHEGAYRSHFQLGAIVPLGGVEARGDFGEFADVVLPYDMQIGGGAFAITPGVTGQVMNENGSVGAQLRGVFPFSENDRGWRPGTRIEGRLWFAHRFNDYVSASAGVRGVSADPIQGVDPDLETLRDPGDLALSFGTQRVDLPLGINVRLPGDSPLAGHRLGAEVVWAVHQQTDGPVLADNWTLILGWQTSFGPF